MRLFLLASVLGCAISQAAPDSSPPEEAKGAQTVELAPFLWSDAWALTGPETQLNGSKLTIVEKGPWILRSGVTSPSQVSGSSARRKDVAIGADREPVAREMASESALFSGSDGAVASSSDSGGRSLYSRYVSVPEGSGPLRASSTDDNVDFDDYLSFLEGWTSRPDVNGRFDSMNVSGQRWIQVRDAHGAPLPGARVSVVDPGSGRVVWSGSSYGDGRVPFYPSLNPVGAPLVRGVEVPEGGWQVQVSVGTHVESRLWSGHSGGFEIQVDQIREAGPVPLDVAFVIDTTGSMSDEIARIKKTLQALTDRLGDEEEVELRYGAVLYRDLGDEYVTSRHPFTSDLEAFDEALQQIEAKGGGDMPESMNQGLAEAVGGLKWRDGVAKVAFVIADAPPHTDYQGDISYSRAAASALHQGIRIHAVAASGLNDLGSLVFRQVAQLTRGKFIFIEYGSVAASAADHGVTGSVHSNNLDAILYAQIRSEIQGWGRESTDLVGHLH